MSLKKILVGYSGFVGSNLIEQSHFDAVFNSSNIEDSYASNPDILVYSGVRAEKFLANNQPDKDFENIKNAIEIIKKIKSKKLILISTVDVYPNPQLVDENSPIDYVNIQAYGKNRLYLEQWVEENVEDYMIIRLPALFGNNLKKNFIYDLINIVPAMLTEQKFMELASSNQWINDYYTKQENTFYKLNPISSEEKKQLKEEFLKIDFSALNFTDSRSVFQFYNLNHLWADISVAMQIGIKKLNLATEPISANEIYKSVYKKEFKNEIVANPPHYNFHSIHANKFNNSEKYIRNKESLLNDIQLFIKENK